MSKEAEWDQHHICYANTPKNALFKEYTLFLFLFFPFEIHPLIYIITLIWCKLLVDSSTRPKKKIKKNDFLPFSAQL
jgi:hypothetical protein